MGAGIGRLLWCGLLYVTVGVIFEQLKGARDEGRIGPNPTTERLEKRKDTTQGEAKATDDASNAAGNETRQMNDGRRELQERLRQKLEERRDGPTRVERQASSSSGIWDGRNIHSPTRDDVEQAKRRLQYQDGQFHFAVTGIAGSGKSSLINALRGLHNGAHGAEVAPTGVTETTHTIARYPDAARPFIWYDVPGAGTLSIPEWSYFDSQGLYIFDCIVVVVDSRFTATDVAILRDCVRFDIPSYIVRSKSLQHIANTLIDMPHDASMPRDEAGRRKAATRRYTSETRESVTRNLERAGLPQQRVYVVDKETLMQITNEKSPQSPPVVLDELELLRDLLTEAQRRRVRPRS